MNVSMKTLVAQLLTAMISTLIMKLIVSLLEPNVVLKLFLYGITIIGGFYLGGYFYLRYILRKCSTLQEVKDFYGDIYSYKKIFRPLYEKRRFSLDIEEKFQEEINKKTTLKELLTFKENERYAIDKEVKEKIYQKKVKELLEKVDEEEDVVYSLPFFTHETLPTPLKKYLSKLSYKELFFLSYKAKSMRPDNLTKTNNFLSLFKDDIIHTRFETFKKTFEKVNVEAAFKAIKAQELFTSKEEYDKEQKKTFTKVLQNHLFSIKDSGPFPTDKKYVNEFLVMAFNYFNKLASGKYQKEVEKELTSILRFVIQKLDSSQVRELLSICPNESTLYAVLNKRFVELYNQALYGEFNMDDEDVLEKILPLEE